MKKLKLLSVQGLMILISVSAMGEGPEVAPASAPPIASPVTVDRTAIETVPAFVNSGPVDNTDYAKLANGNVRKDIVKIKAHVKESISNLGLGGNANAANKLQKELNKLEEYEKHLKAC